MGPLAVGGRGYFRGHVLPLIRLCLLRIPLVWVPWDSGSTSVAAALISGASAHPTGIGPNQIACYPRRQGSGPNRGPGPPLHAELLPRVPGAARSYVTRFGPVDGRARSRWPRVTVPWAEEPQGDRRPRVGTPRERGKSERRRAILRARASGSGARRLAAGYPLQTALGPLQELEGPALALAAPGGLPHGVGVRMHLCLVDCTAA